MSRLKVARLPNPNKQFAGLAGIEGQPATAAVAARGFCDAEDERVPSEAVLRNATGKVQHANMPDSCTKLAWHGSKLLAYLLRTLDTHVERASWERKNDGENHTNAIDNTDCFFVAVSLANAGCTLRERQVEPGRVVQYRVLARGATAAVLLRPLEGVFRLPPEPEGGSMGCRQIAHGQEVNRPLDGTRQLDISGPPQQTFPKIYIPTLSTQSPSSRSSCGRLQVWAVLLSEEKRVLAAGVKARAPPEVVGAHVRFLARAGTWNRLLLDLQEILETAVRERQQAVGLLSQWLDPRGRDTPGDPPNRPFFP